MDSAVTDMVQTPVAYSRQEIAAGDCDAGFLFQQPGKHILDDVASKVFIVQKGNRQPVHLRVMCFEKPLYVVSVRHTPIRHTTSAKLNP